MCHIFKGNINPLVFARKLLTSLKRRLPPETFRLPKGPISVIYRGPRGIWDMPCEKDCGPLLLFTFASGALTPCLLSLRMEIDRGRSFAQERLCWLSRVVTVGGIVAAKPHSHSVLPILDQVRAGKDCGHSAPSNRRQLWRTKGKTKRNQRAPDSGPWCSPHIFPL